MREPVTIGFTESKADALVRLRRAYRLCSKATRHLELCRAERRPREKADHFAAAVVDVRNIQSEIEAAGSRLKRCIVIDAELTE
jgi:hypothetical protein